VRLLGDPGLARSLGDAGLARARAEFSVERMTDETLAVYEAALAPIPSASATSRQ
jgi:glycosyltransferase involved in cell wall biosynthesis